MSEFRFLKLKSEYILHVLNLFKFNIGKVRKAPKNILFFSNISFGLETKIFLLILDPYE